MNGVTSKLFIKSFETILDGYNKSYRDADIELVPTVQEDENDWLIWVENDTVISKQLLQIVDAACRNVCAATYFVAIRDDRLKIRIF